MIRIRQLMAFVFLGTALVSVALSSGCSRLKTQKSEALPPPPIELKLVVNKPVFQVGEAVICEVHLINNKKEDVSLPPPYVTDKAMESDIQFAARNLDATAVLSYQPVHPENVNPPQSALIKSGEQIIVNFVFTNLTHGEGKFAISATYAVPVSNTQDLIHSVPINIEVKGPRLWNRDRDGILLKEDAVKVAVAKYGKPVKSAQAKLVKNDGGFLDWYVSLEKMSFNAAAGESAHVGYFISPYDPFKRSDAPDYMPQLFSKDQAPEPPLKKRMPKHTPSAARPPSEAPAAANPAPPLPPGYVPVN